MAFETHQAVEPGGDAQHIDLIGIRDDSPCLFVFKCGLVEEGKADMVVGGSIPGSTNSALTVSNSSSW